MTLTPFSPPASPPITADPNRHIAYRYDVVDARDTTNVDRKAIAFTIRSVFVMDPANKDQAHDAVSGELRKEFGHGPEGGGIVADGGWAGGHDGRSLFGRGKM